MTDPDLAHRAEQALLGAIIARQDEIDGQTANTAVGGLRPQDFTDPRHQAIYAALTGEGLTRRGGMAGLGQRLRDMLARLFSRQARELVGYAASLPACCPDPAHADSYAGMVATARGQRTAQTQTQTLPSAGGPAAREDSRLDSAAAWLDAAAAPARSRGRRAPVGSPAVADPPVAGMAAGPVTSGSAAARPQAPSSAATTPAAEEGPSPAGPGPLPADIARLARLLHPAIQPSARRREQARPQARDPHEGLSPGARPTGRELARDSAQEQVLAGLMNDPVAAREVTAWLPAAMFSPGTHRGLYALICTRLEAGEPVDALILAWEASHRAGTSGGDGGIRPPAPAGSESLSAAALRIGQLRPAPGTAALLGQALYARHLCDHVFGPGWEHSLEPDRLAAAVAGPARLAPEAHAARTAAASNTAIPDPVAPAVPAARPAPAGRPGAPSQPGRAPAGKTPPRPAPSAPAQPVQPAPPGQQGVPLPAGPAQRM